MRINPFCWIGLIFVLFTFPTSNIFCQSKGLGYKLKSTIDVMGGADIGFRQLRMVPGTSDSVALLRNRKLYEAPKVNYRFGINYIHGLTGTLAAKVGFRYTSAGFNTGEIDRIDVSQDINRIEKIDARDTSRFVEYNFNYKFFEVPLGIRHTMVNSYCQPYIEIGLSTYFYHRTNIREHLYRPILVGNVRKPDNYLTNNYKKKEAISKINFLPYLSIGGNFRITESVSGFSQIIARYQINNLRESVLIEQLISVGGEIGVRYYLDVY